MATAAIVFKKISPNAKLTAYLTKRDFVDNLKETSAIEGVVVVDKALMSGKKVFCMIIVKYRYGREEDETMGLHFAREFVLTNEQVLKPTSSTPLVTKLISKLGTAAQPIKITLPTHAPPSVTVETLDLKGEPIGVTYEVLFYVATAKDADPPKRGCVSIAVRKIQVMPFSYLKSKQPKTIISKSFVTMTGKLNVELMLEKDIYCQGDIIPISAKVVNKSKKPVKSIKCKIIQKIEITITKKTVYNTIAEIESKDGCPILHGGEMTRVFEIKPTVNNFKNKKIGIALDGRVRDADVHLACSTLNSAGDTNKDSLGIIVSYTIKVTFCCGALGGDVTAEVPFRLVYPSDHVENLSEELKIEEFSKYRRGQSVELEDS